MALEKEKPEDLTMPTPADYSNDAVKTALMSYVTNNPLTRYSWIPLPVMLLWVIFVGKSFLSISLLCLSIAAVAAPWLLFKVIRAGSFKIDYINGLHARRKTIADHNMEELQEALRMYDCEEGALQLDMLKRKFDTLYELLTDKLQAGEMMAQRYQGMALEVYLSGVDHLTKVRNALKSVCEVDVDYIESRISTYREHGGEEAAVQINLLQQRLDLRTEQLTEVQRLLEDNELAMTTLDATTVAVSKMETGQDEAKVDMTQSIADLAEIAERANEQTGFTYDE